MRASDKWARFGRSLADTIQAVEIAGNATSGVIDDGTGPEELVSSGRIVDELIVLVDAAMAPLVPRQKENDLAAKEVLGVPSDLNEGVRLTGGRMVPAAIHFAQVRHDVSVLPHKGGRVGWRGKT